MHKYACLFFRLGYDNTNTQSHSSHHKQHIIKIKGKIQVMNRRYANVKSIFHLQVTQVKSQLSHTPHVSQAIGQKANLASFPVI